jgi:hypothetical protein
MSFYIKINNPNAHKSVEKVPVQGSPVEGPAKICLVTAFTSVVGDPKAAYAPDRKNADKDFGWVSVSLAGQKPVTLPFAADEFEDLVLDAEAKHNIADFRSEHWLERLDDLIALRRANDTQVKIGAIESTGDHKGEIYGGIFPDGKPGWILEEPKPLTHYEAVELKGRALPTSKEGKYIDTIKDKGALKDIFARHSDSSSSAGAFWLAEHGSTTARYQQFSDGSQSSNYGGNRYGPLPVLSVRR